MKKLEFFTLTALSLLIFSANAQKWGMYTLFLIALLQLPKHLIQTELNEKNPKTDFVAGIGFYATF